MVDNNRSRSGSLQFYPRVRAKKVIPSVNWKPLTGEGVGLLGCVGYKAGMVSVLVKDTTSDSLTKGKRVVVPATVIEVPSMKIYSVRLYRNGVVFKDLVISTDKVLKRRLKLSKKAHSLSKEDFSECEDIRLLVYGDVASLSVDKKKPDMVEIALSGTLDEKISFVLEQSSSPFRASDVFSGGLVDVHGVTKGFGTQGPVKRFGIALKNQKSEKGRRRPGSLAPWHPARTTFRAPQAGQTGYHSRVSYNSLILGVGTQESKLLSPTHSFTHYGPLSGEYILVRGSIPGPQKRGLVITPASRPSKYLAKKELEVLEIR